MAIENYKKESKNVSETSYDTIKKELSVTFKSFKDPKVLTTYKYFNVPADLWAALQKAESLGGFINKEVVKGAPYPFEKITV